MTETSVDRPIFMVGMGRSGTTAVSEAVSMHPDLGWVSNYMTKFPGFLWIAVLNRIMDLPRVGFHLTGKKKQGKGIGAHIRRYLPRSEEPYSILARYCGEKISRDYLINHTASADEKNRIRELVEKLLVLQGRNRFFAKFTGPPRITYLNSIFPDAYYIHLLRDPRAVVSSLLKARFWRERGALKEPWWRNGLPDEYVREWIESGRSPVALAAVQWKWVVELTWMEREAITKEKFIEVRYEDFVLDPHGLIHDLFGGVQLSDSHDCHRYLNSIGRMKNMNYKYQKGLTNKDIILIESLTGDVAKKAGYNF